MYAINKTSYRAVSISMELAPGEILAEVIPESLLKYIEGSEMKVERSEKLRASDWTQAADSPLSEVERLEWARYRQALRDLPEQETFPECVWPTPPNLREGAAGEVAVK